jgi:hypothetical protein
MTAAGSSAGHSRRLGVAGRKAAPYFLFLSLHIKTKGSLATKKSIYKRVRLSVGLPLAQRESRSVVPN